jgi:quinol monooxygenase YgiN
MKEVTVVARARAKAGKEKAVEDALHAVVPPTHAEAGCLRYIIHRGIDTPSQFVVIERWKSMELLQAHLASDHVQTFFKKLPDLLEGPPEVSTFESIDPGHNPKGAW